MPKPPIKTQRDLENHIRVYINVLKEKGIHQEEVEVLKKAISILRKHYYAVLPNQNRFKKAIFTAMYNSKIPLSIDDLMEAAGKAGLITDRRRLNGKLAKEKRDGTLINPIRGYWTLTNLGKKYVRNLEKKNKKKGVIAVKKSTL